MSIIKSLQKSLQEERRTNARLRAEIAQDKEKIAFLGVLNDVDIDGIFEEDMTNVEE